MIDVKRRQSKTARIKVPGSRFGHKILSQNFSPHNLMGGSLYQLLARNNRRLARHPCGPRYYKRANALPQVGVPTRDSSGVREMAQL